MEISCRFCWNRQDLTQITTLIVNYIKSILPEIDLNFGSSKICCDCLKSLRGAYSFKKCCMEFDSEFMNSLNNHSGGVKINSNENLNNLNENINNNSNENINNSHENINNLNESNFNDDDSNECVNNTNEDNNEEIKIELKEEIIPNIILDEEHNKNNINFIDLTDEVNEDIDYLNTQQENVQTKNMEIKDEIVKLSQQPINDNMIIDFEEDDFEINDNTVQINEDQYIEIENFPSDMDQHDVNESLPETNESLQNTNLSIKNVNCKVVFNTPITKKNKFLEKKINLFDKKLHRRILDNENKKVKYRKICNSLVNGMYVCQECKFSCKSCQEMMSHSFVCGGRLYKCNECNCKFKTYQKLLMHIETKHCEVQVNESTKIDILNNKPHIKILNGNNSKYKKKYICQVCKFSFNSWEELTCHLNECTGSLYKCNECEYNFSNYELLMMHKESVHPAVQVNKTCNPNKVQYACSECTKTFPTIPDLEYHKREHNYFCAKCGRSFLESNDFHSHVCMKD